CHFLFTRAGILETDHLQPLDKSRTVGITEREAEPQNSTQHGDGIVRTAGSRLAAFDLRCAPQLEPSLDVDNCHSAYQPIAYGVFDHLEVVLVGLPGIALDVVKR